MRILLDTHAFVWWVAGETDRMSAAGYSIIANADNSLFLSAASIYEMINKWRKGKWPGISDLCLHLDDVLVAEGISVLDITGVHARIAAYLPQAHGDPFDRTIAAQSIFEGIPVLTLDAKIDEFGASTFW